MNRKIVLLLLFVSIAAVVGISYSAMYNAPAQPSTSTTSCKPEDLAGNYTSSPEMNDTSSGSFNVTFYIQNLGSQNAKITEYTDNNGLTQPVNWIVPVSTTETFQTTIYKPENSLLLETSCSNLFTTNLYYPSSSSVHHYEVTLYVSLGGTAS